jgi:hypothetical protein
MNTVSTLRGFTTFAAAAAIACSGCASGITVTRLTGSPPSVTGNPWNLPMTQFKITITRHLVECGNPIKVAVEAIASPTIGIDLDQRYLLRSNGWFATSDITSTLSPTGISTGLNAQSTDATATVISNIIGTVAQIAVGVAAAGAAPVAPDKTKNLCNPDIIPVVNRLYPPDPSKSLKAKVDSDTAALAIATAKVTLLTAEAKVEKSLGKELLTEIKVLESAQKQLDTDQKQLTEDMKATTDTQVVTWPLKADDFRRATALQIDPEVYKKWVNILFVDHLNGPRQFDVFLALYKMSADGTWKPPTTPLATADVKVGVPVRLAATGRLLVCSGGPECPATIDPNAAPDKHLIANDFPVLQLGPMYVIPVTGGTFKSESATIALDANGLPTSIQSSEKAAAAAGASGAAKDAATQLAALPAAVRAAELAKTQAQTNQLTANAALATAEASAGTTGQANTLAAQTALITAQNNLAEAKQNAGLQIQTSEVSTQSTLLNAQAALVQAQASSKVVDQTSVLAAQTTLLQAQTQQINAAAALAKAKVSGP